MAGEDQHTFGDDDAAVVAALRARSNDGSSLVYAHHVYAEVDALVRRYKPASQSILEIGPGANLGALFCFAAAGFERVAGTDIGNPSPPPAGFYSSLRDYLSCVGGWRWWRQFSTSNFPGVSFPASADRLDVEATLRRIDYRAPVPSSSLPHADRSFDVVYSVAALEHVANPHSTVREMHRVLAPGGIAVHEIDLTHHGSADPFRFLEWEEDEWRRRAERYGDERTQERLLGGGWGSEVYCNRLRRGQWLALFDGAGFERLHDEPVIVYDQARINAIRFVEPFRSMPAEELSVLAFRIVARKRE